ncbi:PilZ domain-containing protein [Methylorubrum suomiense]|uniref:PilZ domain-containing protein n=1 Tax=Methylorubrum suomiense TaxID=144191 RepID=UPI0010F82CA9|nr:MULTISPECIES: PilZ domain-containing protein [Methylobacteriaceae]
MPDRRRVPRRQCNLAAKIYIIRTSTPIECVITDISSYGSFLRTPQGISVPANFDLCIGTSSLPRACRLVRRETDGFGVEFLDPVRHEVEEILIETAFKEEMMFEALSPPLNGEATMTQVRLHRAVSAIVDLIERRNTTSWERIAPLPDPLKQTCQTLRDVEKALKHASPAALPAHNLDKGQGQRLPAM